MNRAFKGLAIGDVVNIVSHSKFGLCEVETFEGDWISYVPFSYMDVLEEESVQEATVKAISDYSVFNRYDWD